MKSSVYLAALLFFSTLCTLSAQDVLHFTNGDQLEVWIVKQDKFSVTFRLFNDPESPVFSVQRAWITKIKLDDAANEIRYPYRSNTDGTFGFNFLIISGAGEILYIIMPEVIINNRFSIPISFYAVSDSKWFILTSGLRKYFSFGPNTGWSFYFGGQIGFDNKGMVGQIPGGFNYTGLRGFTFKGGASGFLFLYGASGGAIPEATIGWRF